MNIFAQFSSVKTEQGIKIFRYNTELHSPNGAGEVIGLVYMMNPGKAAPQSEGLLHKLETSEYTTDCIVHVKSDPTLNIVINSIKRAYRINKIKLPCKYTIIIENLFNIREDNGEIAKQLAKILTHEKKLMFQHRELNMIYKFVWFAWGNTDVETNRQKLLISKFPNAIAVYKKNVNKKTIQIPYPKHPIGMNKKYFNEAALGKVMPGNVSRFV